MYDLLYTTPPNSITLFLEIGSPKMLEREKSPIVEILAFCLMPNHYHLLIKQIVDGGISKFMQKIGIGYTMYFNQKNGRVGPLFQGKFKSVLIEKENQLIHIPFYIHLNALDLVSPGWREGNVGNKKTAMKFLENYRWFSFPDYIGKRNFPLATNRKLILDLFDNPTRYKSSTMEWLNERNINNIQSLTLE